MSINLIVRKKKTKTGEDSEDVTPWEQVMWKSPVQTLSRVALLCFCVFFRRAVALAVGKAPHRFLSLQFPTPRAPLRNLPESTIADVAPQKQSRQRWQPQEQDAGSPCPRSLLPAAGPSRDPSVGKEKGEREAEAL